MEKQEKEIIIGHNRLHLREDNILHAIIAGYLDNKIAIGISQAASQLRSMVDGKVDMLINIDNIVASEPKAISVGITALIDEKIGKVAFIGKDMITLSVIAPLIGSIGKTDVAFFKIEEEALHWLKKRV